MTTNAPPTVSADITNVNVEAQNEDPTVITDENDNGHDNKTKEIFNYVKIGILLCVWVLFTGFLMTTNEKVIDRKQIAIPAQMHKGKYF